MLMVSLRVADGFIQFSLPKTNIISTIPLEDVDGKIKCQSSANNQLTSIFSAGELLFYEETAVNEFDFDESLFSVC